MRFNRSAGIALCAAFLGTGSLTALHDGDHGEGPTDRTFKVSKTGEVSIGTDVKIGNQLVRRGKYMLIHRPEDDRHMFVLAEVDKKKAASQLSMIEFAGRFLSTSEQVKNSTFLAKQQRDRSYEVVKIQIAGENGDHVFTTNVGGNNANSSTRD